MIQQLVTPSLPSQLLNCYDSALITILKYMGLSRQAPVLGTHTFFVLQPETNSISPRFKYIKDEWKSIHGLVIETIPILSHTDLIGKIISKIQNGLPVCLPLDIYFLPHTSHHNSLHQIHFINIFGYDDNQYYMVCPYYRFKGWITHDLIHTAFFAPITEKKELIFIPELKIKTLSHEKVHNLIQESCQYMLGLAVPEELAHLEPQYLGLAGIRTFSDHLKKITDGHGSYTAANMQNLSREIMTIGYSRYWFDKLSHTYLEDLFPENITADLHSRFTELAQSWQAAGLRFAAGIYTEKHEILKQVVSRVEKIYTQEEQVFNKLWEALHQYTFDPASPRLIIHDVKAGTDQQTSAISAPAEEEQQEPYAPPRNPLEQQLAEIWKEVLETGPVSIHDNFFNLGGNSISAMTLLSKVEKQFGNRLSLVELFQAQTIAEQAEIIQHSSSLEPIQPGNSRKTAQSAPPPLSFAQERIQLLQELEPESPAYNISVIRRLKGPLNIAALEQTLQEILRRHEVLRTTLPDQEVLPVPPEHIPVTDCRSFPDPAAEARRLVGEEMNRPFDLGTGPLLRTRLFRLDREDHVLFLGTHQVCCDDQSTGILLQELTVLYAAFAQGQPSPLPEPPVQYADFAGWQRDWLQGEVLEEQLTFWREQLRPPVPRLNLSTSRHSRAISRSLDIPARLHDALRTLSREQGTTLFMTLLAAFQTLLFRCTGEEDILVFSSVGGRNRTEIRGLIGLFTNVLALRTDLSGNPAFRELLGRVRETALAAFSHQDLPFEQLLDLLHAGSGQAPPLQVLFVLQNAAMPELDLPGVQVEPFRVDTEGTSQFDMVWYFKETDAGLTAWLRYRTELSGVATVMAENMRTLLEGIVADPDQRLTDLPCLSEEERQGLPVFINQDQTIAEADRPDPESYVAPRDSLEKLITKIWEEKLKTQPIGIHDHFNRIGGTSLMAALILTETEKVLNKKIPFAALYKMPTIAQWAKLLLDDSLQRLRTDKSRPLFFLPGAGGNSLAYFELDRFLDTKQENELRAIPMNMPLTRLTTLEEIAASYVEQIRAIQPEGPYFLGSKRCSAIVTYETAQQLQGLGQEVAFLGVIDWRPPSRARSFFTYLKEAFLKLPNKPLKYYLVWFQRRIIINPLIRITNINMRKKIQKDLSHNKIGKSDYLQFRYVESHGNYRARPYHAKISLFFTTAYLEGTHFGWSGKKFLEEWIKLAAGGVDFNFVPSDTCHPDMFTGPFSPIFLDKLKSCLSENSGTHLLTPVNGQND